MNERTAERDTDREVAESMTALWQAERERADRLEAMCNRLAERLAEMPDLRAVEALVDDWETRAGEESAAWRVYGPQTISVPFAVKEIRAALGKTTDGPQH